jgi:hypothetical protein
MTSVYGFEPSQQVARRVERHEPRSARPSEQLGLEARDTIIQILTRLNQRLHVEREAIADTRRRDRRVAQPMALLAAHRLRELAVQDGALRQQPGDDVHEARRHLERFAGEFDPIDLRKQRTMLLGAMIEERPRFVGKHHGLDIKAVDQLPVELVQQGCRVAHPIVLPQSRT